MIRVFPPLREPTLPEFLATDQHAARWLADMRAAFVRVRLPPAVRGDPFLDALVWLGAPGGAPPRRAGGGARGGGRGGGGGGARWRPARGRGGGGGPAATAGARATVAYRHDPAEG